MTIESKPKANARGHRHGGLLRTGDDAAKRPFLGRMPPQGPGGSPICEGRDKGLAGARAVWGFQLRRKALLYPYPVTTAVARATYFLN